MVLRGIQVLINAGAGNLISGIYDAQPPATATSTSGAATARSAPNPDIPALREQIDDLAGESELGSNGLALGSRRDAERRPGCCCQPALPLARRGPLLDGPPDGDGQAGYDAMGGTLGGFPMIGVGFNRSIVLDPHGFHRAGASSIRQLRLDPGTRPATSSTASRSR